MSAIGKSLTEANSAVAAALAAVANDGSTTRDAILALAAKQNASNVAIHASLASVRDGLVQIAQAMTANGQDVDGQILATAQAIEIHDFNSAPDDGSSASVSAH